MFRIPDSAFAYQVRWDSVTGHFAPAGQGMTVSCLTSAPVSSTGSPACAACGGCGLHSGRPRSKPATSVFHVAGHLLQPRLVVEGLAEGDDVRGGHEMMVFSSVTCA